MRRKTKPVRKLVLGEISKIQDWVGDALKNQKGKTVGKIVQSLNENCQVPHMSFHQQRVSNLSDAVLVAGLCQYEKRQAEIDIYLQYSDFMVSFTTPFNQDFPVRVVATILHEMAHRKQFSKWCGDNVNRGSTDNKTYLAEHIEIDAFALEIAYELWVKGKTSILRDIDNLDPYTCPHLIEYRVEFGINHPIYKRLIRKIVKNLSELGVDKF